MVKKVSITSKLNEKFEEIIERFGNSFNDVFYNDALKHKIKDLFEFNRICSYKV
jgi:hypothetical protein